jgi:hypothetical protein
MVAPDPIPSGNGRIANPHFAQYRVPRFSDVPRIETVVLDRKDLPPAGAGETPLVALAPAVATRSSPRPGSGSAGYRSRPPDCRPGSDRGRGPRFVRPGVFLPDRAGLPGEG